MNILITGGTGFIGTELCRALIEGQHQVSIVTRKHSNIIKNHKLASSPSISFYHSLNDISVDESFDIVINLVGEPIANKRWSQQQKQKIIDSRINTTSELIAFFNASENKPKAFISGSAIGYYGIEASDNAINELGESDNSFSSELCIEWENIALQAQALGIRTCLLRTGIVLGRNGGALSKMLPPFKLGLGGKIGTGEQWMPWIHIDDIVGIILHCIDHNEIKGPINGTSPQPLKNTDFTHILGKALNRPTVLPMPAFMIKLLMGEMGTELLLSGKRVIPLKALDTGYRFKHPKLEAALNDILS